MTHLVHCAQNQHTSACIGNMKAQVRDLVCVTLLPLYDVLAFSLLRPDEHFYWSFVS